MIPQPEKKEVLSYTDCTTRNIIDEVLSCYKRSKKQLKEIAATLRGNSIYDSCRMIWEFVKDNIRYIEDPADWQFIKTPAATWADGYSDCKGYSIFIASLLYNSGINFSFRFTSYDNSNIPTHVYIVVKNEGREIILDCVLDQFDREKKYTYKKDFPMVSIVRVSGFNNYSGDKSRPVISGGFWDDVTGVLNTVSDVVDAAAPIYTTINTAINPPHSGPSSIPSGTFQGTAPTLTEYGTSAIPVGYTIDANGNVYNQQGVLVGHKTVSKNNNVLLIGAGLLAAFFFLK